MLRGVAVSKAMAALQIHCKWKSRIEEFARGLAQIAGGGLVNRNFSSRRAGNYNLSQ